MSWEQEFGRKLGRVLKQIHPETCFHEMRDGTFAIEDVRGKATRRFESVHIAVTEANAGEVLAALPQRTREVFAAVQETGQ